MKRFLPLLQKEIDVPAVTAPEPPSSQPEPEAFSKLFKSSPQPTKAKRRPAAAPAAGTL